MSVTVEHSIPSEGGAILHRIESQNKALCNVEEKIDKREVGVLPAIMANWAEELDMQKNPCGSVD